MKLYERINNAITGFEQEGDINKWLMRNLRELTMIECEVRRNVKRAFNSSSFVMDFESGHIRILADKIKNKVVELMDYVDYNRMEEDINKHKVINDESVDAVFNPYLDVFCINSKLLPLANLFNYLGTMCYLYDLQKSQAQMTDEELFNQEVLICLKEFL